MASSNKEAISSEEAIEQKAAAYLEGLDVPSEHKEGMFSLVKKMMSHECYNNPEYKWSIEDFELGYKLGSGGFGDVFLAREKKTGFIVALKALLKKEMVNKGVEKQIVREIEIQSHLKHSNILRLFCWFHDSHRIYLVLEFAGEGDLYEHLKKSPESHFDEHRTAKYIYQVADAVHYCHQNKVIHRDIKPKNLLLTFTDDVKLGNFGLSVHSPSLRRNTICGTLNYYAPEMLYKRKRAYTKYVDHWAVGILCYEFLVGNPPFQCIDEEETIKKIKKGDVKYPDCVSSGARDLISKLLVHRDHQRMELTEVMNHCWIVENK